MATLDDSPAGQDPTRRWPVPAWPSAPVSAACSCAASPSVAMAVLTVATKLPMLAHGAPGSVSRNGVLPSRMPLIVASVAESGKGTVPLTANPVCGNVSPGCRVTRIAADALLTTDSTYCGEFESSVRLRWVSSGTIVVPSGSSCETTRLKSALGLRTPVCWLERRRSLPQAPGLAALTSKTGTGASSGNVHKAVVAPTTTRTIHA